MNRLTRYFVFPFILLDFISSENFCWFFQYPKSLGGKWKIKSIRDLTTGYDNSQVDMKATLPADAKSQMITFTFENGVVSTLRTSGTEPKLKYYAEFCGKPENKDWDKIEQELDDMVAALKQDFIQAEKYGLE